MRTREDLRRLEISALSKTLQPLDGSALTLMQVGRDWLLEVGRPEQWQETSVPLEDLRHDAPWAPGTVPALFLHVELTTETLLPAYCIGAMVPMPQFDLLNAENRHWNCHYALEYTPGVVFSMVRLHPF